MQHRVFGAHLFDVFSGRKPLKVLKTKRWSLSSYGGDRLDAIGYTPRLLTPHNKEEQEERRSLL